MSVASSPASYVGRRDHGGAEDLLSWQRLKIKRVVKIVLVVKSCRYILNNVDNINNQYNR